MEKKGPWQLVVLIEEHECKGVGKRQWCTLAVHGSHNETKALVTLASNSFMNIFWACNYITRELTLAVWIINNQFVSMVGLQSYFQQKLFMFS